METDLSVFNEFNSKVSAHCVGSLIHLEGGKPEGVLNPYLCKSKDIVLKFYFGKTESHSYKSKVSDIKCI